MQGITAVAALSLAAGACAFAAHAGESGDLTGDAALQGVAKYICYEEYDQSFDPDNRLHNHKLGVPLRAVVSAQGDHAYVRVDALLIPRPNPDVSYTENSRDAHFLVFAYEGHVFAKWFGDPVSVPADSGLISVMKGGEAPGTETLTFTAPADCGPPGDAMPPLKTQLLNEITAKLAATFALLNAKTPDAYPAGTEVTIENFEPEYEGLYVFVPSREEFWSVRWHAPVKEIDEGKPHGRGILEITPVSTPRPWMKERVLAHGIAKTITPAEN